MTKEEIAKEYLLGHTCDNCGFKTGNRCTVSKKVKKFPENKICKSWKEYNLLSNLFSVVRNTYPSSIANKIVSVQPMAAPNDIIYTMKTIHQTEMEQDKIVKLIDNKNDLSENRR